MAAGVDEGIAAIPVMLMEPRPFRPFKTSEEYLWAMKEDLAEWLHSLYNLDITAENFFERLETGVTICQHANRVRQLAIAQQSPIFVGDEVVHRCEVSAGTFHARDNISNFIKWCRGLGIMECLLFETDDLVLRKNERSFILCLLEIARRGAKFGMPAPILVQMEEEIDREIMKDIQKKEQMNGLDYDGDESEDEQDLSPPLQIITNDLKSLDEMVRDLVNRCSCPVQFPMIRVSEGKYRIGDTQTLIFVRILRSHVMVRVGGGWDTLEHYLDKHDPCRCRQGHRSTISSKFMIKHGSSNFSNPQMQVTYERTPEHYTGFKDRISPSPSNRVRRASLSSNPSVASKSSTGSLTSNASDKERHRKSTGDGVGISHLHDVNSRRLSDGDVYLRATLDHLDEGYYSGSKALPSYKIKEKIHQLNKTTAELDGHIKENSDCSSGVSTDHEAKPGSPDSNELEIDPIKRKNSNAPLQQALEAINRLSRKKSQSTEELGGKTTLSIHPSASTQTLRRMSCGKPSSGIPVHMTRSRSQYSEDSEMARYLSRATKERLSCRTPRSNGTLLRGARGNTQAPNTWSCRPRASRPSLTPDTFNKPPNHSNSPSPQRRSRSGPARTTHADTLHVTPNKTVLPLVQEVLSAAGSQEQLLRKMAELVAQHKPRAKDDASPVLPTGEDPGYHYTSDWVAATAKRNRHGSGTSRSSPVEDSGSEAGDGTWKDTSANTGPFVNGQSRIPVRVNPRKDSAPGSTRIPVPTFYSY